MGRPRKIESDDRYNEESLNLHQESFSMDSDDDEGLVEVGMADSRGRFAGLNDRTLYDDNRS